MLKNKIFTGFSAIVEEAADNLRQYTVVVVRNLEEMSERMVS